MKPSGTIWDFGKQVLAEDDLCPLPALLNREPFSPEQTKRFLLAYLLFWHAGVAAYLSEFCGNTYWYKCWDAVDYKWPRGRKREFFGGEKAMAILNYLRWSFQTPEAAIDYAGYAGRAPMFFDAADRVAQWPQFHYAMAFHLFTLLYLTKPLRWPCVIPLHALIVSPSASAGAQRLADEWGWGDWQVEVAHIVRDGGAAAFAPHAWTIYETKLLLSLYADYHAGLYLPGYNRATLAAELAGWGATAEGLLCRLCTEKTQALDGE